MFKTFLNTVMVLTSALMIVGCNKSKSSDNSNAQSTMCLQNPTLSGCNNAAYNNYGAYGYQPYPYGQSGGYYDQWGYYRYQSYQSYGMGGSSLCSCPSGSRPVYNGQLGTGCVAYGSIPNYARTYYWSWSAGNTNNNHYVNWNQMSNINTNESSNNGCYNNVAWSCVPGQANQCPTGTACAISSQNSPIGICVHQ